MKTAISVPDTVFRRVDTTAARLGISRSELFSRAADAYLKRIDEESTTARIDEVLSTLSTPDDATSFAVDAGRRTLASDGDAW